MAFTTGRQADCGTAFFLAPAGPLERCRAVVHMLHRHVMSRQVHNPRCAPCMRAPRGLMTTAGGTPPATLPSSGPIVARGREDGKREILLNGESVTRWAGAPHLNQAELEDAELQAVRVADGPHVVPVRSDDVVVHEVARYGGLGRDERRLTIPCAALEHDRLDRHLQAAPTPCTARSRACQMKGLQPCACVARGGPREV